MGDDGADICTNHDAAGIFTGINPNGLSCGRFSNNIISPLMPYFAVIIAFGQKYDKNLGIGTLVATMLPYSIIFLVGWTLMLIIWMLLGIPLGPAGPITYP